MVHWLDWNQRASKMSSFTWKLEDLENKQPEIIKSLGWEVSEDEWREAYKSAKHGANTGSSRASSALFNPKVGPITQWRRFVYNNRKHPVTWDELSKIDPVLTKEIQNFSQQLGYKI